MIATVINYCTNDYRFLDACLKEAWKFSKEIIIPVCDHFFDGVAENRLLLEYSYAKHPDVKFIEFAFGDEPYGIYSGLKKGDDDWIHYWHSTARYVGDLFVSPEIEYVLFLDVDEVADGNRMKAWLSNFPYQDFDEVRFTSYFYFREAKFQSLKIMRNALLVKKVKLKPELLLDVQERWGAFNSLGGTRLEDAYALDDRPLFHHYSWVRTKEEMLRKVVSWGHHLDKDWSSLIEEEFKAPFQLKENFWGLNYKEVAPFIDPLTVAIPVNPILNPHANITKVNRLSIQAMRIKSEYF